MNWKNLLESVSESANDHLRLRNDYIVAENRILRNQIDGRVPLTDSERKELAEIGAKLGKQALSEIATVAQPDTILAWHRQFADQKVDTSEPPKSVGRPRVDPEIEDWVIRMARENRSWGYDRIQGALNHLGYSVSDQTVGNILKRHSIPPAPERKKTVTWREFVRSHWDVFMATGFFNSDIWSWFGLIVSALLNVIDFGRQQVQSVSIRLYQPMQTMRVLTRRCHDLIHDGPRWAHLAVQRSRARRAGEAVLGQTESEFEFADGRQIRSQDMGQVMILYAVHAGPIRDGPLRRRPQLDGLRIDDEREAA